MTPWECPRCGSMNAAWVARCNCPPRYVITSSTTALDIVVSGGGKHEGRGDFSRSYTEIQREKAKLRERIP